MTWAFPGTRRRLGLSTSLLSSLSLLSPQRRRNNFFPSSREMQTCEEEESPYEVSLEGPDIGTAPEKREPSCRIKNTMVACVGSIVVIIAVFQEHNGCG
jgi:hypothetical protein